MQVFHPFGGTCIVLKFVADGFVVAVVAFERVFALNDQKTGRKTAFPRYGFYSGAATWAFCFLCKRFCIDKLD